MKKIILLLAVAASIIFTSCNSDDDNSGPIDPVIGESVDKFIGNWKLTKEFSDGVQETLTTCELKNTLAVTDDFKFSFEDYIESGSTCVKEDTSTGKWENLGDDKYKITPDDAEGSTVEAKVTFSGTTMTVETVDEDEMFKQEFVKI